MGRAESTTHQLRREEKNTSDMTIMRIAVAGTGGLARLIAQEIEDQTSHHAIFLSRNQQAQSSLGDYQVVVVDYANLDELEYALRGIDTIISTVTGPNQIQLIHAAARAHVRRFAPAEFDGPPRQNNANNPLDRQRTLARQWLLHYSSQMQSTIFVCGILYERFQPGGLAHSRLRGASAGLSNEGDFIISPQYLSARIPAQNASNPQNPATIISMTAARDVARFVCRAIDLPSWPPELRICGERITIIQLVQQIQAWRNLQLGIQYLDAAALSQAWQNARAQRDEAQLNRVQALINTLQGHYDFDHVNWNQYFPDLQPMNLATWMRSWRS